MSAAPPNGSNTERYESLFDLASGGMGRVSVARLRGSAGFQRLVALKTIHAPLAADPLFREMFFEEARLASSIHHANVVPVLDLGSDGGTFFLAMEYVPGEPLTRLIEVCDAHGATLPFGICTRLAIDACAGLHAAHELRDPDGRPLDLVHRDVSPSNLIVTEHGTCRLTDFGIAKALTSEHETTVGALRGKARYMSPEQVAGQRLDRRSDVFALGVVLYEMTTMRRLFTGTGQMDILESVARCTVPDPREFVPDYPEALARVLFTALAKDRRKRYATAEAMGSALERVHHGFATPVLAADVAAFVREHLGEALEARRRQIAVALRAADGSGAHAAVKAPAAVEAEFAAPDTVTDDGLGFLPTQLGSASAPQAAPPTLTFHAQAGSPPQQPLTVAAAQPPGAIVPSAGSMPLQPPRDPTASVPHIALNTVVHTPKHGRAPTWIAVGVIALAAAGAGIFARSNSHDQPAATARAALPVATVPPPTPVAAPVANAAAPATPVAANSAHAAPTSDPPEETAPHASSGNGASRAHRVSRTRSHSNRSTSSHARTHRTFRPDDP